MRPLRNLRRRPLRTALTVTGVTLAIALSFTMFSLSGGMERSIKAIFDSSGVDIFVIAEEGNFLFGVLPPIEGGVDTARAIEESDPDIAGAYGMLMVWGPPGATIYASNDTIYQKALSGEPVDLSGDESPFRYTQVTGLVPDDYRESSFGGVEVISGGPFTRGDDPFYQNGTYANGTDSPLFTGEILINEPMSRMLNLKVGDDVYLNTGVPASNATEDLLSWYGNATAFRVVGITRTTWENSEGLSANVHRSELQYITGRYHQINQILIDLRPGADADAVRDRMVDSVTAVENEEHTGITGGELFLDHRLMRDVDGDGELKDDIVVTVNGDTVPVLLANGATGRVVIDANVSSDDVVVVSYTYKTFPVQAYTQDDFVGLIGDFLDTFEGISLIIAIITALVAFLFTSTIMALAIRERTKEIGVLRAIGISRRSIFTNILLESLSISLTGFLIGGALGFLMAKGLNATILHFIGDSLPPGISFIYISLDVIFQVSALAILIGIASGFLPAVRATRLNISEVIRSE